MADTQTSNTALEVIKMITPIATFIAGFCLSEWRRISEKKTKVRNIKTILFKELGDNYRQLNNFFPQAGTFKYCHNDSAYISQIFTEIKRFISHSVYDAYLDQIDMLTSDGLEKIYDAHFFLKQFEQFIDKFRNNGCPLEEGVVQALKNAHEKCEEALRVFKGGDEFIKSQVSSKGYMMEESLKSIKK